MPNIIRKETENSVTIWNLTKYMEYYRARELHKIKRDCSISDHPIIGKQVPGRDCVYESVHRHWYAGWYLMAIYVNPQRSHGTEIIENINSIADFLFEGD